MFKLDAPLLLRIFRSIIACFVFLAAPGHLRATTALSLDLDSLVRQSWAIAQVKVGDLQSFSSGTSGSSPIETRVTFIVQKVYKGQVSESIDINFLGGVIGTRGMAIQGMPKFKQGQRLIVFLANPADKRISGTIGLDQGVLRVVHDPQSGSDRVYRWWGQAVNSQTSFKDRTSVSMETTTDAAGNAETLSQFETQLAQAITRAG
jgi:hypothetical protein